MDLFELSRDVCMPKRKLIIPDLSDRLNSFINMVTKGNQSIFARKIQISEAYLSQVINEHNGCSLSMIYGIIQAYPSININWLLTGRGKMYSRNIRLK